MEKRQKISVVVPVFCEEKNIAKFHRELNLITSKLPNFDWEYVFVNDGSSDKSYEVLKDVMCRDNQVKVVDLSRNFGKEAALSSGVHCCCDSDAVICMDADLQHPPEIIPQLLKEWSNGAEVVVTVRKSTERKPIMRKVGASIYYWLMNKLSDIDIVAQTTDFRLIDKKVVRAFLELTERERMFRGIIDWLGFRRAYIDFIAKSREDGDSKFSYRKLWKLAIGSITSFSLWPLRVTGYLGLIITTASGLLLSWMFGNYLLGNHMFTPLAIFVVANTFLVGIVLMAIGLVALYIGTIHTEVINRPIYVVREKLNFSTAKSNHEYTKSNVGIHSKNSSSFLL